MPRYSDKKIFLLQFKSVRQIEELLNASSFRSLSSQSLLPHVVEESDTDMVHPFFDMDFSSEHDALLPLTASSQLFSNDDSQYANSLLQDYNEIIEFLEARRYWLPRQNLFPILNSLDSWFNQPMLQNPHVFRSVFRMDRESFDALANLIETHPVFQKTVFGAIQRPVNQQLAVFLYRLGGGGSTQTQIALTLGIGDGTVPLYFKRVLHAILSLKSRFIRWPSVQEKRQHKLRVCQESLGVFPSCIGFVDGTYIPLKYAPLKDWFYCFNRKGSYGLNAMVVCSDMGRIIYTRVGDTSAVHDARIFDNSQIGTHPETFFNDGEFLIGDSAYTNTGYMVTPFKKPFANCRDCRIFNATLSSRRIVIEHVFGIIKARFPAITLVPVKISDFRTHKEVVDWFESTCVLHNFLLDQKDESWDTNEQDVMAGDGIDAEQDVEIEIEENRLEPDRQHIGRSDGLRQQLIQRMRDINI